MGDDVLDLKEELAELCGLNTNRLQSFTITANMDEPVMVEAVYVLSKIQDEDVQFLKKKFVLIPVSCDDSIVSRPFVPPPTVED